MADTIEAETEYDNGPELLQTEETDNFACQAPERPDGQRYLSFGGTGFPSLSHVEFGLCLTPETTQQEAEAVAELINKHCPSFWAAFYNRNLSDEYYELNEHGLAKLDGLEYVPGIKPFSLSNPTEKKDCAE
jgi:hypothetical protein